jgi:exodeoxyribonuclease V
MNLSLDQQTALDQILSWLDNPVDPLTLGGYAGTGKTTLIAELCRVRPDLTIAAVTLTGKAISVLDTKLRAPNVQTSTIHHFMYSPVVDPATKKILGWKWRPMLGTDEAENHPSPASRVDLIINDEASMTSRDIYNDLLKYEVPLLCVGDHGQLPPVNSSFNLMKDPAIRLEQIHRQAEGNPIIALATIARTKNLLPKGDYSDKVKVMKFGQESDELADLFSSGDKDTLIITATNQKRIDINAMICHRKGKPQNKPFIGARLICLKNDRNLGLYNGMQVELTQIHFQESNYWDVSILTDSGDTIRVNMDLGAFGQAKPALEKMYKIPFDFGWAVTCHKAQGSEAKRVFVIGSGFGTLDDQKRWMYTAITRARDELYVLL